MFRHREDRVPVAVFLAIAATDFAIYFSIDSPWWLLGYLLLMVLPKGIASAWNHHHQHVPTFRRTWLNRALELVYGLQTGMPTNVWVLHHVLGHHLNYLDQTRDESRWRRADGSTMGELEYTLSTVLTAYPRAFAVGRRKPKAMRPFLVFGTLTWALAIGLTVARPLAGLCVFLAPMVLSLFFTAWVTYDHHAGLATDSHFEGSFNIMNHWFNRLTGNLGYHTAHHYKQGVHWSRLPELHAEIADRIPAHCYTQSFFDRVLPDAPRAATSATRPVTPLRPSAPPPRLVEPADAAE